MMTFSVDVSVPADEAETFAQTLTGNDDDAFLAAERALRRRMGKEDVDSEIELIVPEQNRVKDRLRAFGEENFRL